MLKENMILEDIDISFDVLNKNFQDCSKNQMRLDNSYK